MNSLELTLEIIAERARQQAAIAFQEQVWSDDFKRAEDIVKSVMEPYCSLGMWLKEDCGLFELMGYKINSMGDTILSTIARCHVEQKLIDCPQTMSTFIYSKTYSEDSQQRFLIIQNPYTSYCKTDNAGDVFTRKFARRMADELF